MVSEETRHGAVLCEGIPGLRSGCCPEYRYKNLNTQHSESSGSTGGIGGYLNETNIDDYKKRGKVPEDYWLEARDDMSPMGRKPKESMGYPTEKPPKLLERIINATTSKGGIVLDPFCGCGTTVVAARNLERRWLGVDISPCAIDLVKLPTAERQDDSRERGSRRYADRRHARQEQALRL